MVLYEKKEKQNQKRVTKKGNRIMERKMVLKEDIKKALEAVGVKPGQSIMVHTSMSSLGSVSYTHLTLPTT